MRQWTLWSRTRNGDRILGVFPTRELAAEYARAEMVVFVDDGRATSERPAFVIGDPVDVHGLMLEAAAP